MIGREVSGKTRSGVAWLLAAVVAAFAFSVVAGCSGSKSDEASSTTSPGVSTTSGDDGTTLVPTTSATGDDRDDDASGGDGRGDEGDGSRATDRTGQGHGPDRSAAGDRGRHRGGDDRAGERSDRSFSEQGGGRGAASGSTRDDRGDRHGGPGASGGVNPPTTRPSTGRPSTTSAPSATAPTTAPPTTTRPGTTVPPATTRPTTTVPPTTTRPTTTVPPTTTRPTTTVPGREPPGPDPADRDTAGWRFSPANLIVEPGASRVVELVHADENGRDDGGLAPDDPTLQLSRDGVVTMTPLGQGRFLVTAGTEPGSVIVGALVPHGKAAVPLSIGVAQPAPGVKPVTDEMLVFPRADVDEAMPVLDVPYYSETGVGPFTWEQIVAVTRTPAPDSDEVDEPDNLIPVIVVDADLGAQDLLYSPGDAGVAGQVVAAQSIEVDGRVFTLLSVAVSPIEDVFDLFSVDVSMDDYWLTGIYIGEETGPFVDPDPDDGDDDVGGGGGGGPLDRVARRDVARIAASARAEGEATPTDDTELKPGECKTEGGLSAATIKAEAPYKLDPVFAAQADILTVDGKKRPYMGLQAGIIGKLEAALTLKFQLSGSVTVTCYVADLSAPFMDNIPLGPLSPFLTGFAKPKLMGELKVEAAGGPEYTITSSCSQTIDRVIGFRFNPLASSGEEWTKLDRDNTTDPTCEPFKAEGDTQLDGTNTTAFSGSVTMSASLDAGLGITIGGSAVAEATDYLVALFGKDLGFSTNWNRFEFLTAKLGTRWKGALANTSFVLRNKTTPAQADMGMFGEVGLNGSSIKWLSKKLLNKGGFSGGASYEIVLPKVEFDMPLIQFYRGIARGDGPPELRIKTAGSGDDETFVGERVALGDTVTFETATKVPVNPGFVRFEDRIIRNLIAYVKKDGEWQEWIDFAETPGAATFTSTVPADAVEGPTVRGTIEMTRQVCSALGSETTDVAILSRGRFLWPTGNGNMPGYVTDFKLGCANPDLRFDPVKLQIGPDIAGQKVTENAALQLVDPGREGAEFEYRLPDPASWPDWFDVEGIDEEDFDYSMHPATVMVDGKPMDARVADVPVQVDCEILGDTWGSVLLTAELETPEYGPQSETALRALVSIDVDCRDKWTMISPNDLDESGGTAVISYSAGQKGVSWSLDGGGATYSPSSGTFDSDSGGAVSVEVSFEGPEPECGEEIAARTTQGLLTTDHVDADRAGLRLHWKARHGEPCDPDPPPPPPPPPPPSCTTCGHGGGKGDPHMYSFDGLRFDMQTDGEYRYVVADPDVEDADVPAFHIQHSYYQRVDSYVKTIRGAALDYHGHRVEAYHAPEPKILIDGEEVGWTEPVSRVLTSDFTVSIKKNTLVMTAGGMTFTVVLNDRSSVAASYLNVDVTVPFGAPVRGILGSYNGDPSDDLQAADGHTITVAQARAHDSDFFGFTESWRVTDLADSLFSEPLPTFDWPVGPYDPSLLAPYVAQVQAAFADLAPVCAGLDGESPQSYTVLSIAFELFAGTPIDEAMAFTCSYRVSGNVQHDPETFVPTHALAGFDVHIGAPGLASCDTVLTPNGGVSCEMTPDPEALRAGAVSSGPPVVTMVVTHPVTGDVVATTSQPFTQLASFGASASLRLLATAEDPVDGTVTVSGELTRLGEPITTPTTFGLVERDADGAIVWWGSRTVTPDADGHYRIVRVPHPLSQTMEMTFTVGDHKQRFTRTVDLDASESQSIDFDVAYEPTAVTVGGVWDTTPGAKTVQIRGERADGSEFSMPSRKVTGVDGRWSLDVEMPPGTVAISLTAQLAAYAPDNPTATFSGLSAGHFDRTMDVIFHPRMVDVGGRITVDGTPPSGTVPVLVEALDTHGTLINAVTRWAAPDPVTGAYSVGTEVPQATGAVRVTVKAQSASATWRTVTVPVTTTNTSVTLDAEIARQIVEVSGRLRLNGQAVDGPVPVTVSQLSAGGAVLGTVNVDVTPDASGNVTIDDALVMPFGTTDLRITARFGEGAAGTGVTTVAVPPEAAEIAFDIDHAARIVTLNGTFTSIDGPFTTWFQVYWSHVDGSTTSVNVTVDPDENGRADFVFLQPMDVTGVSFYQSSFGGDGWLIRRYDFDSEPNTTIIWDGRPTQLRLSGQITRDGVPIGAGTRQAKLQGLDADGEPIANAAYQKDLTLTTGADSRYTVDLTLPEALGGSVSTPVSWRLRVVGPDGVPVMVDLGSPPRGATTKTADVAETSSAMLTVKAWTNQGNLDVTAYSWVPGSLTYHDSQGKWIETAVDAADMTWTKVGGAGGSEWEVSMGIPNSATFVKVSDGTELFRVFELDNPGAANAINVSYDSVDPDSDLPMPGGILGIGQGTVTVTGPGGSPDAGNWCPGQPDKLVLQVSLTASGSRSFDIGTFTVFTDLDDGRFELPVALPDWDWLVGEGWIHEDEVPDEYTFRISAHPSYSVWSVAAFGSQTVPVADLAPGDTIELDPGFGCAQ